MYFEEEGQDVRAEAHGDVLDVEPEPTVYNHDEDVGVEGRVEELVYAC